MALDGFVISNIVYELNQKILNAKIFYFKVEILNSLKTVWINFANVF